MTSTTDFNAFISSVMRKRGLPDIHLAFESVSLAVAGETLHLDVMASPHATATIINIPGTAVYGMFYAEFCHELAKTGFNVITFDHRGHGRSTGKRGCYTVSELINDAKQIISYATDRFASPVYLTGASQGSIIALYTAAADSRVKGIACKNIADLAAKETEELTRFPLLTHMAKPILNRLARHFPNVQIPLWVYLNLEREKMNCYESLNEYLRQDPWALKSISLAALASLASQALETPLEKITTPVMVIQSESDEVFPVHYVQAIFNKLGGPRKLEILAGQHGHLLFSEHVKTVVPLIVNWISALHRSSIPSEQH